MYPNNRKKTPKPKDRTVLQMVWYVLGIFLFSLQNTVALGPYPISHNYITGKSHTVSFKHPIKYVFFNWIKVQECDINSVHVERVLIFLLQNKDVRLLANNQMHACTCIIYHIIALVRIIFQHHSNALVVSVYYVIVS